VSRSHHEHTGNTQRGDVPRAHDARSHTRYHPCVQSVPSSAALPEYKASANPGAESQASTPGKAPSVTAAFSFLSKNEEAPRLSSSEYSSVLTKSSARRQRNAPGARIRAPAESHAAQAREQPRCDQFEAHAPAPPNPWRRTRALVGRIVFWIPNAHELSTDKSEAFLGEGVQWGGPKDHHHGCKDQSCTGH
jgi:hypothetical protein